ncbi:MAG: hypothetical protein L0211_04810 [Planctomycetaceae bacterium]|nr:hypothetical protein [Planctomycetaceae bacterium]
MVAVPTVWNGNNTHDASADPLADFQSLEGKISLWRIEEEGSNINDVVVALASTTDRPDPMDFLIFDSKHLDDARIEFEGSPGISPFAAANEFHIDAVKVKARSLAHLVVSLVMDAQKQISRIPKSKVLDLVASAVKRDLLAMDKLKKGFREEVQRQLAQ